MLAYLDPKMLSPQIFSDEDHDALKQAVWIDLLSPSKIEEELVEKSIAQDIPTRAEMVEIELSSRLYFENDTFYMTATMLTKSDTFNPILDPVTFVLTKDQLVTIRYIEPQSFKLFNLKISKLPLEHRDATTLLIEILDATIDRLADILELVGHNLDDYSKIIFQTTASTTKPNYQELMQKIGIIGDLNTKARESLLNFNRLIAFFSQTANSKLNEEKQLRLVSLTKDISSLSDHANFLSTKINFLLDATLGMVSIEQNNIIKIFSVAAVIFLPPTLIASIYGMNFHNIPELSWKYGYLIALGLIVFAAWLPYKYFKHRKWL